MARKPLRTMSSSSEESSAKGDSRFHPKKGLSSTSLKEMAKSSIACRPVKSDIDENRKPCTHRNSEGEKCFEEKRANSRYYTLANSVVNFNLLQICSENNDIMDENSDMDMDIATEEEYEESESSQVETDENNPPYRKPNNHLNMTTFQDRKAPLNVTTLHGTICDTIVKKSNPRKVLFDVNSSLENRSFISATNNTSTTSSVCYNENEAVGVQGDKEETVNTKFAARELSMMFSSPAPNNNVSGNKNHTSLSSKKSSSKLLFSVHRSKHCVDESNDSSTAELNDSFNLSRNFERISKPIDEHHRSVFKIFEESSSQETSKDESPNPSRSDSSSDNSSVNSSKCGGGEDTASLADIMDLMKDINNNNGTVVTDDITCIGGDLSCILHNKDGDTIRLQEKVSQLDISDSS